MHAMPLILTSAAGLATVLGGWIALIGKPSRTFHARSLGFAAGVMLYLSIADLLPLGISLLPEPGAHFLGVCCFLLGITLPLLLSALGNVFSSDAAPDRQLHRLGLLSALSILLHNLPEGIATFTAAGADLSLGIPVAIAIALHNIPEGIAIAVPLRRAGESNRRVLLATAVSGLSEPIGGLIGWCILRFLSGAGVGTCSELSTLFGILYTVVSGIMTALAVGILLPTAVTLHGTSQEGNITAAFVRAIFSRCLLGIAIIAAVLAIL